MVVLRGQTSTMSPRGVHNRKEAPVITASSEAEDEDAMASLQPLNKDGTYRYKTGCDHVLFICYDEYGIIARDK